jgi:hypothetical protein
MMTPEERDALIDVTVEACAKLAETFHQQLEPPGETAARGVAKKIGALIAASIRKEFRNTRLEDSLNRLKRP